MTLACPECGRPATEPKFRPFCDKTCSDADLDRVRGVLLGNLELLAANLAVGG